MTSRVDACGHLLVSERIDVEGVLVAEGTPTGRAVITVDEAAENTIVVIAGANRVIDGGLVPAARLVIAQLEVPVEQVLVAFRTAHERGMPTVLNPAPAQAFPTSLLDLCDVVIPNEHEVELLGGALALLDRGVGTVITTRGAAGVTVIGADPDGSRVEWVQDPFTVEAIDTTGAGDAFCGALAARWPPATRCTPRSATPLPPERWRRRSTERCPRSPMPPASADSSSAPHRDEFLRDLCVPRLIARPGGVGLRGGEA